MTPSFWPLLATAAALFAVSGLLRPRLGAAVAAAAALSGLTAVGLAVALGAPDIDLELAAPFGRVTLGADALTLAFLLPILVVPALGAVYGTGYLPADHPTARRTRLAYGALPATMIGVVVARDAFTLLVAWEGMAISALVAISADDDRAEVRASSFVYLVATHLGTLALIAAFAVLGAHTGGLAFTAPAALPPGATAAAAVLFLVGFGAKAGLVPLHVWLPGAHANAPSHVSAVMSGVVLKMGVYGILRAATLLPELPAEAGATLLTLGALGALGAAAMAVAQRDLKRLLAYSSVDNLGIVLIAVGLALYGRATGHDDLVALGVAGAILHVWSHALFKPLLFFVAGAVIHATGTRELDRLGGAARALPKTARASLVGALALSGLPPLNGFVGELFIYVALFHAARVSALPALAAPALAITGALALLAALKLHGGVFLGAPRDPTHAAHHHEPTAMAVPTTLLALACLAAALAAPLYVPWLAEVVAVVAPGREVTALGSVPVATLSAVLAALVGALALVLVGARLLAGRPNVTRAPTWSCGYAGSSPRLQYTPSSLADTIVRLLRHVVWPRRTEPRLDDTFPAPARVDVDAPDPILDRLVTPAAARAATWSQRLRARLPSSLQAALFYVLLAAVALLMGV